MVSQFSLSVLAQAFTSLRNSGVMEDGSFTQPRKSLPLQVPFSKAFTAAAAFGKKLSTAPCFKNEAALVISKRIFSITFVFSLYLFGLIAFSCCKNLSERICQQLNFY